MKANIKVTAFAAAAVLMLAGGLAWACTEAAGISLGSNSGPAGTAVTIQGSNFAPGPVEIRWNNSKGQVLGTAQGPDFSTQITPPAGSATDVYYVVAIQKGQGGTFKATETFEVVGASGAPAVSSSTDLWSGFSEASVAVDATPAPEGASGSAMAGFGLAGFGAVVLAGGLVATAATRRRSHSR
ncbi:MAG: IPT/TIG domain-containing protein [Actinomycetota bacterium]